MRAAIYARVSTFDQEPEDQLQELRRYVEARTWTAVEYVDRGVSGAKDRRPALDQMIGEAKRRRFDVLVCWRLDRLGRNLKHLVTLIEDLQALGIAFVSLGEGIDCTTPAGKLQLLCAVVQDVLLTRHGKLGRGGPLGCGHITLHKDASQPRRAWSSRHIGEFRDPIEGLDGGSHKRSAASLARIVISA